ncbi:MAG: rod shape-determining protein RodA [Candidatus Pacebacteria bacterium]|nr:rod shape-determining protein RodA [Candidatus Paceibacterota bacterium]
MKFLLHLKKMDWGLNICAVLLSIIGIVSLYSSGYSFEKQIVFLMIGLLLMLGMSFFDFRILKDNSYLILILYFLFILLLVGLFLFAPQIKGAARWYRFGFISFDPLEFGKLVLIILLAKYFSSKHVEMYKLQHILVSGFYIFVPALLIFLQPDFGSVLILIVLWSGILLVSGIKLKHFIILILIGLILFSLSWLYFLKDYQRSRIINFLSPEIDPLGAGWSQRQAKIAIGAGGFWGQGIKSGSQTQLGFLPEPHTDFIFAAIAEEFGFLGVFILFLFFIILIQRIIKIALFYESNFIRLFSLGLAIVLISQFIINIGMNLGLLPVVGLPLILVSYGGSSLVFTFLGLGILQSIKLHA